MKFDNVVGLLTKSKMLNNKFGPLLINDVIKKFLKTIFDKINDYPLVKKEPLNFMIAFIQSMHHILVSKPLVSLSVVNEINNKLYKNEDITIDEFIEFLDELSKKYPGQCPIVIEENTNKIIFVSGNKVLFDINKKTIKFKKNSINNLKKLAENNDAQIVITTKEKNSKIKEMIMTELVKHELYNIEFASTKGVIYHKDIIKNHIKKYAIEKNNYVVLNSRKVMGNTLKDRLITVIDGISQEDIDMADKLLAENI